MVRTGSAAAVVAGVMLQLSRFALAGLFIEGARGGLVGRGKFPVEEVVEHVADLLDDPPDQRFWRYSSIRACDGGAGSSGSWRSGSGVTAFLRRPRAFQVSRSSWC